MVGRVSDVIIEMIKYYANDARRVNHFMKVYSFAKSIGELEKIDKKEQEILEIAAVVHDIGIKISEEKYNSSAGKYQEIEGAKVAEEMLINLGIKKDIVDRVCFLVGHHHTYNKIDNIDFQILVEADFLVNIYEDEIQEKEIEIIKNKIIKTKSGIEMINKMFL